MTITDRLKQPGLKKGAALLPSLFTIGNLFLGFSAIILSLIHISEPTRPY